MIAEGPYFDELIVGQTFPAASAVTLTDGVAAAHQAVVGDRLTLALDEPLARTVTGGGRIAHPALVWDIAIGQSTVATHHVKANLFYRGLAFRRAPVLGDTLSTVATVAGLRRNRDRDGRPPTGLVALQITTADQNDRPVLDFWRCAMLPLRDSSAGAEHMDDLDPIGGGAIVDDATFLTHWDLEAFPGGSPPEPGSTIEVAGGDTVSNAPELARLILNVARVHHDPTAAGGRRLVYGGHTIGVALSQATRAFPGIVTVIGWHGCDHLGPVYEGDILRSTIEVGEIRRRTNVVLVDLRSLVTADDDRPVLDWRYVAAFRG